MDSCVPIVELLGMDVFCGMCVRSLLCEVSVSAIAIGAESCGVHVRGDGMGVENEGK